MNQEGSYGSYGASYGAGNSSSYQHNAYQSNVYGNFNSRDNNGGASTLRRRNLDDAGGFSGANSSTNGSSKKSSMPSAKMVKNLDFMFPKVEAEYTVSSDGGGMASLVAYVLVAVLCLTEILSWISQNATHATVERTSVDTRLGQRMRVNINLTFPALHCEDLHLDVMDVAGDSQFNVEGDMHKVRLGRYGYPLSEAEKVESNEHHVWQQMKDKIVNTTLPEGYCGPCYGAHTVEDQCCNTCDEVIQAYKTKNWNSDDLMARAEQCIREGRDQREEPKRMAKGEGCNLFGHFTVNRVNGNFHVAMGEGIERNGRHIHTFLPEDTPNFNASHIIHHLSFGPEPDKGSRGGGGDTSLNGVTKIVTEQHGTTGLFQYYIKVVPTTYLPEKGKDAALETNRYFFTESFRPLITEIEEEHIDADGKKASVHAGHGHGHDHRHIRNSILPGVFFIYEIYPFAVEVRPTRVPFTHLLIRLMSTVGGVFTVMRWFVQAMERK